MFDGFGPEKMIFILLVLMLVFGTKRLPEIGGAFGRSIREFKKSLDGRDEAEPARPALPRSVALPAPDAARVAVPAPGAAPTSPPLPPEPPEA